MRSLALLFLILAVILALGYIEPIAFVIGMPVVAAHYHPVFTFAVFVGFVLVALAIVVVRVRG